MGYETFFPFNSVFSLSIFLKEAHFNSSVEIRFMEGGCFCKLALSVHLQELFSPRVLKRFFFFFGFFLSTMEKTSSAFCYFLLCLCTLVQQMTQTDVSCRFFLVFLGFYLFLFIYIFFYIFFRQFVLHIFTFFFFLHFSNWQITPPQPNIQHSLSLNPQVSTFVHKHMLKRHAAS